MKSSESTVKISAALVKAIGELSNPPNSATNPFFKSKYAPLPDILNHVRPVLAKHKLCVIQDAGVTTRLVHESGEWLESDTLVLTPVKDDPQGVGSAITYARRYALSAMLGISSEDDDDANRVSNEPYVATTPHTTKPPAARAQDDKISPKQVKYLHVLFKQKCTDPDAAKVAVKKKFGLESLKDLDWKTGKKLIDEFVSKADVETPPAEPDPDGPDSSDLPF